MGLSLTHLIVLLIIIFVVFGAGKLPRVMGDVGKGIRNLRDGMGGDDETPKPTILPPARKKPAVRKKTAVKTARAKSPTVKSAPRKKPTVKAATAKSPSVKSAPKKKKAAAKRK